MEQVRSFSNLLGYCTVFFNEPKAKPKDSYRMVF